MIQIDDKMTKAQIVAAIDQAKDSVPELAQIDIDRPKARLIEDVNKALEAYAARQADISGEAPIETKPAAEPAPVTDEPAPSADEPSADEPADELPPAAGEKLIEKAREDAKAYHRHQAVANPMRRVFRS